MGANLTLSLETAPQLNGVVSAPPQVTGDPREVLRCPGCGLVQFRTTNSRCRRCAAPVDVAPPVAEPRFSAASALEPGQETAEASGAPMPNVAAALRACRQRQGLSQRQLAERMQVPRTYVSKIENDKATPTIASLERMAAAMDTSVARLLAPSTATPSADAFLQALAAYLPLLNPADLERLLTTTRQLAGAPASA